MGLAKNTSQLGATFIVLSSIPLSVHNSVAEYSRHAHGSMSKHPKGLALEVTLPRRPRGFETGIDNPAEGSSPGPGQRGLFGTSASDFKSPSLRPALRSARAKSGRRFQPYAHPELCPPPTPGSALANTMGVLELSDYIMYGDHDDDDRPVSSRTRTSSSSTWSMTSSSGVDSSGRPARVPRHLRALAQAAEYSSSTSPRAV